MMKKLSIAVVAVVFAATTAGCKKGGVDCEQALDNAVKVSKAEMTSPAMEDKLAKIRAASLQRCKEDKWSADALKCFAAAKTGAELGKCEELKTKEQREKLEKAVLDVMGPPPPDPNVGSGGSGGSGSGGSGVGSGSAMGSGSAKPAAGSGSATGSGAPKPK